MTPLAVAVLALLVVLAVFFLLGLLIVAARADDERDAHVEPLPYTSDGLAADDGGHSER